MRTRVLRDPLYGYVHLPVELTPLINHPLYQRLRRVVQTSLTSMVYPSATGTRFEHGLGAMHLAMRGWVAAWEAADEETRTAFRDTALDDHRVTLRPMKATAFPLHCQVAVGGAALLHDVGHPPFSHVLEPLYGELAGGHLADDAAGLRQFRESGSPYHEWAGRRLAATIVSDVKPVLRDSILAILDADPATDDWLGALHSVIAGEVDIDRLDYLMRDAQKAGTEFGAIDYARLVDAFELHSDEESFKVAPGIRARSAVETLLLQRTQAYKWITFHTRVVGANYALAQALAVLRELSDSDHVIEAGPELEAKTAFGPAWPNLNYVMPRPADVRRQVGHLVGEPPDRLDEQTSLGDEAFAPMLEDIRIEMQAGIDDGVVLEGLKRANLIARALRAHPNARMDERLRQLINRYLTFSQHALFRRRNALAAWKTVEEFDAAASDMKEELVKAVTDSYDSVKQDDRFSKPETQEALEGEKQDLSNLFDDDAVVATNRIVTLLFDEEPGNLEDLARELGEVRRDLEQEPGFWGAAYTGFTAVKRGDEAAVMFDGNREVEVFASSPLAQALERVEAARYRLCLFFFVTYPAVLPTSGPGESREMRERLLGDFVSTFPRFVRKVLPGVIRISFSEPEFERTTAPSDA